MYKRLLFSLLGGLTLVLGCTNPSNFQTDRLPENLREGLIAFYAFKSGSLDDGAPGQHHLSAEHKVLATKDRWNNTGCGYYFNNLEDEPSYLYFKEPRFLNQRNFSISLWYQPQDTSLEKFEILIRRGQGFHCGNRYGEWSIGLTDCRRLVFAHDNTVWAPDIFTDCQEEVEHLTNKWHHVVAIRADDEYRLYYNGVLQGTSQGRINCTEQRVAMNRGDLNIGKHFTGKIDDILIFNRVLSDKEIRQLSALPAFCQ